MSLPRAMVEAWRRALLKLARLPRGINPKEHEPEDLLKQVVRQEAGAVGDLWEIFTQERGALTRNLLSGRRESVAYLLGFHLANAARAHMTLTRAAEKTSLAAYLKSSPGVVWHDLGAGAGAVAQTVAAFTKASGLAADRLTVHLYDAVGPLLDAGRAVFDQAPHALYTHRVPLEKLDPKRLAGAPEGGVVGYSLGYVWNELDKNTMAQRRLLELFTHKADSGEDALLLVLEPATERLSRGAMDLRDQVVGAGWVPLYPCPKAVACPMRRDTRDWCYSEGDWRRPPEIFALDRQLGMDRSRLTGSCYLFATQSLAARLQPESAAPTAGIVVGRPTRVGTQHGRGPRFDYIVCTGDLKKVPPKPGKPCLPRGVALSD